MRVRLRTMSLERCVAFLRLPLVERVVLMAQIVALALIARAWWQSAAGPWPNDAYAFWNAWADGRLYPDHWEPISEFVYSPAFAQAFWPLTFLPWPVAYGVWTIGQLAALVWMLTPLGAVGALLFPLPHIEGFRTPVAATIYNGNPVILVAAAMVAGMRWPAAWSLVLLTKVSAGIGILYFVVRGEWRKAGIALGVTGVIVLVSFVARPALWFDWFNLLFDAAFRAGGEGALQKEQFLPLPLAVRGVLGILVVAIAGRREWPWLVPLGCFLALPDIHLGGWALLWAMPAIWWRTVRDRFPATSG